MKLSLVIPVYNTEKYLEKCLSSCLNQNMEMSDYEIVIVNDGTKDNAMDIARQFQDKYPNVGIYSQENAGLSAARNTGFTHASGDYVWFVDSDDWIEPDSVKIIFEKMKNEPDVICIQAREEGSTEVRNAIPTSVENGAAIVMLDSWKDHCVPFYVMKKAFLERCDLHFHIGILHEDTEFTPRMLVDAQSVEVVDKPLYNIFLTPNSLARSRNIKRSYDCLTVAKRLDDFGNMRNLPENLNVAFSGIISLVINNAFDNIRSFGKEERDAFNKYLYENRGILRNLKFSKKRKYNIEYQLFSVFKNYTWIYITLTKLKRTK
ncbi:MAG: glycosyltransferase [Bacteroidales bacterium]|nr:glycosyltransferase [Bacteroidales bacterium]